MGFLDMFDSPDIMSSLLGINTSGVPNFTPTSADGAQPPTYQQPPPAAPPASPSMGTPFNEAFGSTPSNAYMGPGFNDSPSGPDGAPPAVGPAPAPGAPLSLVPSGAPPGGVAPGTALPPNSAPTNGVPPQLTNLANSLGISPQQLLMAAATRPAPTPMQNAITTGMAGLGKGLSAVGAQRPGATGAASFAAGMGGALTGGTAQQNEEQNQARQRQNDLFTQSSTAFRDMMAAKSQDDTEGYRQAQGNYLNARAASIQSGGSATGSNAWQNSPYGKTIQVENEAQKYEKGQQILLQKRWAANGTSPDQQQTDLDNLSKNVDAYRGRLYKQVGVDPSQGAKMKDMGTSPNNAFETKGMSLDQFNHQVLPNAWYKDQNDVPRQRTASYDDLLAMQRGNAAPATAAPNPQSSAPTYDDMQAMQPTSDAAIQ